MYIIIGGAGDAGRYLGRLLSEKGHKIAYIDNNKSSLEKASEIDALTIEGEICDFRSLLDAGIDEADLYIGLAKNDSVNLVSSALANFYGCKTFARVKSSTLAREPISRRYVQIGVDIIFCPHLIAASQLSRTLIFPSRLKEIKKSNINIYHTTIDDESVLCNKKFSETEIPKGVKIVSIFRGVKQIFPEDKTVFQSGDELCLFLDERVNIEEIEEKLGIKLSTYGEIKNVFIAGATELGLILSKKLVELDIPVTVMDLSKKKIDKVAEENKKATVIHADPLGHGVLQKEGIEQFDVLLAMSGSSERNTFLSVLAKQFDVKKAVSLIERVDLKETVEGTLVDSAIIPNQILVKAIINTLEEHEIRDVGKIRRAIKVKSLQTKDILLEKIKINKKSRCLGKKIGTFSPEIGNFLISAVYKDKKGFIPDEEYVIKKGDILFVLYHSSDYDGMKRWLVG